MMRQNMDASIDAELVKLLGGKYEVECQIGQGAQGNVYRGRCMADGRSVAIKQLRVESAKNWKQYELFAREAEVLASLNVPGTAKFYEAIQALDAKHPMSVIVQEYIDGRSLQTYLNAGSRFQFSVTCQILIQLLDILKAIHTHDPQVIHRDLKPSNILLRYDDGKYSIVPEVFLIDFGAVANPQVQDGGSTVTGTYGYMAPEQLVGRAVPGSDIYAFAVIAVYMLSGVPPENIEAQDLQLLIDPHLEHLPHSVTAFLRLMLDKSPLTRLTDYEKIRQTLERFQNQDFRMDGLASLKQANSSYMLSEVKAILQPGNIVIWDELPDATPRKIPDEFREMLQTDQQIIHSWMINDYNQPINLAERQFGQNEYTYAIGYLAGAITFGIGIILLIAISAYQVTYFDPGEYDIHNYVNINNSILKRQGMYLALIIGSVFGILYFVKQYEKRKNVDIVNTEMFNVFFASARKSLARIEDITLISASESFDKYFGLARTANAKNPMVHQDNFLFNQFVRPLWMVKYSFNPPDDQDPAPICHVYYSDVYIDRNKIGETLPILYTIYNGIVYSMPFPLPPSSSILQCPYLAPFLGVSTKIDPFAAMRRAYPTTHYK